jgi:hypothetical protein
MPLRPAAQARRAILALAPALAALAALAAPLSAATEEEWAAFRQEVARACIALVGEGVRVAVEVNPFGSEHFGVALLTITTPAGRDRVACIVDKATGAAELTAPFAPVPAG